MKTYVEREYLSNLIDTHLSQSCGAEHYAYGVIKSELKDIPDANVVEIKYAHRGLHVGDSYYCSACGRLVHCAVYCENCGAKMIKR